MSFPIGLQLWSVKDAMEADFFGTLETVAAMGYDGVEFAGYQGHSAAEIKSKLDELGLKVAGSHIQLDLILNQTDDVIAFEKELGNSRIICPWANFETEAEWRTFFEQLKMVGEKINEAGLELIYHNHNQEFEELNGMFILDAMLEAVPFLTSELDTYWSEFAGVETVEWMKKHTGRLPVIHLKDMNSEIKESTTLGTGCLPIQTFVEVANKVGVQWLVIEQEAFDQDPLKCVEIGLRNLKKLV